MAYYFLFPEKDSTVYSVPDRSKLNTGHDEILEIVKEKGTSDARFYPSRIFIKFKNEEIKTTISDTIGHETFNDGVSSVALQLFSTEHKNLPTVFNLNLYALSQSWDEGSGRFSNLPTSSDGCSWVYRDNDTLKTEWESSNFTPGTTGSITSSNNLITFGGGTWYTGSDFFATQQFVNADKLDTNFDVTSIIQKYSSSFFEGSTPANLLNSTASLVMYEGNLSNIGANAGSIIFLEDANGIGAGFISISENGNPGTELSANGHYQWNISTSGTNDFAGSPASALSQSINLSPLELGVTMEKITIDGQEYQNLTITQLIAGSAGETTIKYKTSATFGQYVYDKTLPLKFSSGIEFTYEGIDNNGFVIKRPKAKEENISSSFGELKYFSVDTHTIYPPKLAFKWDDSIYPDTYTGSAKLNGDLNISLYRNEKEYNQNDVAIFRVHVRDKYPTRKFTTTSNFLDVGYFTTSSFYSVRDAYTEEEIIPFDTSFTKMSADSEGMYFKIHMNGLQPERYYRLLFKHTNNDGTTVYDDNFHFKIIR